MTYAIATALGKRLWETDLVLEYADQTGEKPVIKDLAGRTYCQFPKAGFVLVLDPGDAAIDTIQVYPGDEKRSRYKGELPFGLRFEMASSDVRQLLGNPTAAGGGRRDPLTGGIIPQWVRYDKASGSVHCEFGLNDRGQESVRLVTLMTPRRVNNIGNAL